MKIEKYHNTTKMYDTLNKSYKKGRLIEDIDILFMHWDKKVIEWCSIKPISQQWRISIDIILHRDTDIYLSSISEKGWK